MKRHATAAGVVVALLLAAAFVAGCGGQPAGEEASDLTAGSRAELVTVGGARLDPRRAQQVTFHVNAGQVRIIAELTGDAPLLQCTLAQPQDNVDAAHWKTFPLKSSTRPAARGTIFVLKSSRLEPGTYRLSYTGRGWLKFLGMGANY